MAEVIAIRTAERGLRSVPDPASNLPHRVASGSQQVGRQRQTQPLQVAERRFSDPGDEPLREDRARHRCMLREFRDGPVPGRFAMQRLQGSFDAAVAETAEPSVSSPALRSAQDLMVRTTRTSIRREIMIADPGAGRRASARRKCTSASNHSAFPPSAREMRITAGRRPSTEGETWPSKRKVPLTRRVDFPCPDRFKSSPPVSSPATADPPPVGRHPDRPRCDVRSRKAAGRGRLPQRRRHRLRLGDVQRAFQNVMEMGRAGREGERPRTREIG